MNVIEGLLSTIADLEKRIKRLEISEHKHPMFNLGTSTELTISGGVITRTQTLHRVDTEGDAASDDLDTINGGVAGDILILYAQDGGRDVVCKDATGNLYLAGDFTLTSIYDKIVLINIGGTTWRELSRSDNVA